LCITSCGVVKKPYVTKVNAKANLMTKIYFVRHGQASFAEDNYDKLSTIGIAQASLLNEYLANKHINPDVIITGSMLRHQETAEHSLKHLAYGEQTQELLTVEDARWNEYDHQNILGVYNEALSTPKKTREYLSKHPQPMAAFQQHFIAAIEQWMQSTNNTKSVNNKEIQYSESWEQFTSRILSALNELTQTYPDKTVIVYSSGGPISLIASQLLGLPLNQFIHINWSLVNAGITKVITRGKNNNLTLSTLNEHHILEQQNNKKLITYT